MEPIGLAVGIAGLAGLFTTCLECFNIVQQGRYFGHDYWILEVKYANQRLRLQTWGRACGLADANGCTDLPWDEHARLAVETTLQRMAALLQDYKTLQSRYGLSMVGPGSSRSAASAILGTVASKLQLRTSSLIRAQIGAVSPWSSSSARPSLPKAIRWAVQDKQKFADLVQHLKDFNDDLEVLTAELNVLQRQGNMIREEVGSIIDIEELKTIETARMGLRDLVADTASLRLCQIQEEHLDCTAEPSERPEAKSTEVPSAMTPTDCNDQAWESLEHPVSANIRSREDLTYYQVLHRVLCDSQPTTTFFDEPSYQTTSGTDGQWLVVDSYSPLRDPAAVHLSGRRPLHSFKSYLEQNNHLAFLVFKEYKCSHDTDTARTAESTQSCIYLVSDAMCSTLESFNLEAEPPSFCPTMELRSPYEWFYHNRSLLADMGHLELSSDKVDKDDRDGMDNGHDGDVGKDVSDRNVHSARVARTLLGCIQSCMATIYDELDQDMGWTKMVKWEHLQLIFPPDGVVIELQFEGDVYERAAVQLGPVHFTHTKDENRLPVAELTVTDSLHPWTAEPVLDFQDRQTTRKIHIPRSHFHGPRHEASINSLPIYPYKYATYGIQENIVERGRKYHIMNHATKVVRYNPESLADAEDPLDQYIIDSKVYEELHQPRLNILPRTCWMTPDDDLYDEETELTESGLHVGSAESEDMWILEQREAWGDISPNRRRFFACQPHVIYSFHLRDHVWRKLLVDRVVDIFPEWGPWQEMILGHSKIRFLQRLLGLDERASPGESSLQVPTEDSVRAVMAVRGPAANEAIDAISTLAERPLYRIRISTESEAGSAEKVFRKAAALAKRWRCFVVIEDVIGAYHPRGRPRKGVNAAVAPLLWFLDAFKGVVIFALPDQELELDQRVENRLSASLHFEYEDATPANRRALWKRCIRHSSHVTYSKLNDLGPVAEGHLDRLAEYEMPWDTIRSIVNAATGKATRMRPNLDLLMELAAKRVGDVELSPSVTKHSKTS